MSILSIDDQGLRAKQYMGCFRDDETLCDDDRRIEHALSALPTHTPGTSNIDGYTSGTTTSKGALDT